MPAVCRAATRGPALHGGARGGGQGWQGRFLAAGDDAGAEGLQGRQVQGSWAERGGGSDVSWAEAGPGVGVPLAKAQLP